MFVHGTVNHANVAKTGVSGIAQAVTAVSMGRISHVRNASRSSMKSICVLILLYKHTVLVYKVYMLSVYCMSKFIYTLVCCV